MLKKLKKFFVRYFFNDKWKCQRCGREIFDGYFCPECMKVLPKNDGNICNRCGRKTDYPEDYCITCSGTEFSADMCRSAFYYNEISGALIHRFKYRNKRYMANMFSEFLANLYFKNFMDAEMIVFVPMTEKEKRERGYNQSELLADKLSERLNLPVVPAVGKVKDTVHQVGLDREQRLKNLKGAFKVTDKNAVKGKKILLVDDVMTTGTTVNTISAALKKAGAEKVLVLTVASTPAVINDHAQ